MSGGALDYAYARVDDVAIKVSTHAQTPLHRVFAAHLIKVANALKDLEWMLSDDTTPGSEVAAINACIADGDELELIIDDARKAADALNEALARIDGLTE